MSTLSTFHLVKKNICFVFSSIIEENIVKPYIGAISFL